MRNTLASEKSSSVTMVLSAEEEEREVGWVDSAALRTERRGFGGETSLELV